MGLELTEDVIRQNMPEYLPGAANSVNQVSSGVMFSLGWMCSLSTGLVAAARVKLLRGSRVVSSSIPALISHYYLAHVWAHISSCKKEGRLVLVSSVMSWHITKMFSFCKDVSYKEKDATSPL